MDHNVIISWLNSCKPTYAHKIVDRNKNYQALVIKLKMCKFSFNLIIEITDLIETYLI